MKISTLLMAALPGLIGILPARAELPVRLTLDAREITREEAARSSREEGAVLTLVRITATGLPADGPASSTASRPESGRKGFQESSEALTPGRQEPGIFQGAERSSPDQTRMHEQGVQRTRESMHGHDTGAGGHMRGTQGDGEHMRDRMEGMGGHSKGMTGHGGDRGMERSRMHETGMMGGPGGGMMSDGAAARLESIMGPGGSMMGGGAVPEMHEGDGMMGGGSHEGMMGGGTGNEPGGGGMHGGDDNPGSGGHGGGSMGGGG